MSRKSQTPVLPSLPPVDHDVPRAIAAGIRSMALVSPQAALARMSVKRIMSQVKDVALVTCYFDDLEAARTWLRNPTATP